MASTRRICSLVSIGAAFALLALPAAAQAGVTCSLASGVLTVDITAGSSTAGIQRGTGGAANDINVYDGFVSGGSLQACTGSPTVNNTDSIVVTDSVASHNANLDLDLQHGSLEPGASAEGTGTSEIEVTFNAGDGSDLLNLTGQQTVADNYSFGQTGASAIGGNLNGDADVDDITVNDGEKMNVSGGNQADTLSAAGGSGFTGPVPYNSGGVSVLHLDGGLNDDHLTAGPGGWQLDFNNAHGNDTLVGGSGSDEIGGWGPGDDMIDGGSGALDTVDYQFASGGVHFDLGITGPQDTVTSGVDTATNVEGIVGSQATGSGDVLIGDAGNNSFFANDGDDLIVPEGGGDTVFAGLGADTVSYALGSTGPVTVSLGTTGAQATGGAGTDAFSDNTPPDGLPDVENLIGSPFGGDSLTGNALPNLLDVYDGFGDSADCVGLAGNRAIADELGVDSISNCDPIDNAPQTSIDSGPASGTVTKVNTATYGLSSDEPSGFQYRIDSGTFTACPANCSISAIPDGTHTLAFRAVDADENQHPDLSPATRTLTVDTTAPETTIGSHPKPKTKGRRGSFTFSSSEAGSTFLCSYDGKPFAACSGSFTTPKLKPGRHRFDVLATDALGNRDQSAATFLWRVTKRKRR